MRAVLPLPLDEGWAVKKEMYPVYTADTALSNGRNVENGGISRKQEGHSENFPFAPDGEAGPMGPPVHDGDGRRTGIRRPQFGEDFV